MDKNEAERIKLEVLERRNYLKELDAPVKATKRNLYGGMINRVRRRADRRYFKDVKAQKIVYDKKLVDVNAYLKYLDEKELIKPLGEDVNGGFIIVPESVAPQLSRVGMVSKPVRLRVKHFPRGIKGRAEGRRY